MSSYRIFEFVVYVKKLSITKRTEISDKYTSFIKPSENLNEEEFYLTIVKKEYGDMKEEFKKWKTVSLPRLLPFFRI